MYLVIIMSFKKPKIYIFGEKDGQKWMGRQPWGRHHQQNQHKNRPVFYKFGQVQTSLDKFGQVQTSLDKFRQVWGSLDIHTW